LILINKYSKGHRFWDSEGRNLTCYYMNEGAQNAVDIQAEVSHPTR
jgi:hypothetical protein